MISSSTPALHKRLESIQALRGIAALFVLLFHMAEFQRQMAEHNPADVALTQGMWDNGWAGVDLFFVISGFILVYVTRNAGRSFKDIRGFITSRIIRIYPLWWVCACIMAVYFWATYGIPAAPDRVSGPGEAYTFLIKSLLLIPQDVPPILGLGWTLIHEMFFYIIFAALLFASRQKLFLCLGLWAALTIVGNFMSPTGSIAYLTTGLIFSPQTLEFILGAMVAIAIERKIVLAPKVLFFLGAILVACGLVFFPDIPVTSKSWLRVSVFALPFALLIYGWVNLEQQGKVLPYKWLSTLGNWSYSLYLTHYIVIVALRRVYRLVAPESLVVGAEGFLDNIVFAILVISLSICVAAIFYHFVEKPSLKFLKTIRQKPSADI